LEDKKWYPGAFKQFYVHDPKKRLISAPIFKDRIIHHALVNIIEPLFEKKFIIDSYACRKDKGVHKAVLRLKNFEIKSAKKYDNVYAIKADIHHYFQNVDHDILLNIIKRTIRDKSVLWLCERIILGNKEFDFKGISVGSLTSQLFANIYLDQLDHFIKDKLGVKFYVRYMDDFIILGENKCKMRVLLGDIEKFLNNTLKLELNPKTSLFPAKRGVDFAGYRSWTTHILPRKRNVRRAKKRLKKLSKLYQKGSVNLADIKAVLMSFLGYMKHCDGYRTTLSVLQSINLTHQE
jgi:RNA-directed DNA polymerase